MLQIIVGALFAFTSGLLFTINSAVIDYLRLDFADCLLTRYVFQTIIFAAVIVVSNNTTLLFNKSKSENKEKIVLWISQVDEGKNIHMMRTLLILQGICGAICALGIFISVLYMPIGDATAIYFSSPVATMVLAYVFFGEKLKLYRISCAICVMTGIVLIIKPQWIFGNIYLPMRGGINMNETGMYVVNDTVSVTYSSNYYFGASLAATASIARGCQAVIISYLYSNTTTKSPCMMGMYAGFGGLALAFAAIPFDGNQKIASQYITSIVPSYWAGLVGIAISGVLAVFSMNKSVELIGSILDSFIRTSDVIIAYLIQIVFLHETISFLSLLGASCILLSIVLISLEAAIIKKIPDCAMKRIL